MPKNKKLALKVGIETYQILTSDDELFIPSLSSIFLAVQEIWLRYSSYPLTRALHKMLLPVKHQV